MDAQAAVGARAVEADKDTEFGGGLEKESATDLVIRILHELYKTHMGIQGQVDEPIEAKALRSRNIGHFRSSWRSGGAVYQRRRRCISICLQTQENAILIVL